MKVVFDFAGVLFHWRPPSMLQRELPHRAPRRASAAHWVDAMFQGYGGDWGEFDRGTVEVPALVERIAQRTGLGGRRSAGASSTRVPHELQPVPDTVALLRRLRDAGRALYYLSNMPAPYADHLEARHDFVGWFRDGVFSARVRANKPEAGDLRTGRGAFRCRTGRTAFIDDHLPNVQAARALGWHALHFTDAAQAAAELRDRGWA